MQSLTFSALMVSEKSSNVKVFDKPRQLTDQKHVNYLPRIRTRFLQIILYMILLMSFTITVNKNLKSTIAVCISDTPVTLKQSQGYQTYSENIDPEQVLHAKFEKSRFKSVREKGNVKVCFQTRKYVNYLP